MFEIKDLASLIVFIRTVENPKDAGTDRDRSDFKFDGEEFWLEWGLTSFTYEAKISWVKPSPRSFGFGSLVPHPETYRLGFGEDIDYEKLLALLQEASDSRETQEVLEK